MGGHDGGMAGGGGMMDWSDRAREDRGTGVAGRWGMGQDGLGRGHDGEGVRRTGWSSYGNGDRL